MFTAVMLRCIFGHRWHDIANTIPKSSGITTKNLVGTIIFFVLTLPLLAMKIHKLRHLWVFKLCILPRTLAASSPSVRSDSGILCSRGHSVLCLDRLSRPEYRHEPIPWRRQPDRQRPRLDLPPMRQLRYG